MARPLQHRHLRPRLTGDDAGVALVEFALLLPFLAILVFGTIDLGRGFQMKNRATNMAREGAFYGQFQPSRVECSSGEDIVERAEAEDPDLAIAVRVQQRDSGGNLTDVTGCETVTVPAGNTLLVTVESDLEIITPLVGAITGSSVSVSGTSEVVVQG
jgi:Flp pilus assembly protein TadG